MYKIMVKIVIILYEQICIEFKINKKLVSYNDLIDIYKKYPRFSNHIIIQIALQIYNLIQEISKSQIKYSLFLEEQNTQNDKNG